MQQVTTESLDTEQSQDASIFPVQPQTEIRATKFSAAHLFNGRYGQYAIDTSYFTDEGVRVLMTAAPSSNTSVDHEAVRVGRPIDLKVVTWTAERTGAKPKLPHWDTKNPNEILISKRITPANPHLLPDNQIVWRVHGEYVYRLKRPITTAPRPCGTTPVEIDTSAQHTIDSTDFDDTLLDASQAIQLNEMPIQG